MTRNRRHRHHRRPTDALSLWRGYLSFRRRTRLRRWSFAILEFALGVWLFYRFIAPKIYG